MPFPVNFAINLRNRYSKQAKEIEKSNKKITGTVASLNKKILGLEKRLDQLGRKNPTAKLNKRFQNFGKTLSGIGTKFLTRVSLPILAGFGFIIKSASDAQETFSKFDVTFSSVLGNANRAAKDLRDNFSLSTQESKRLLSNTGDLLAGFNFTQKDALKLSVAINKLAADTASFSNITGGVTQASRALTKGLLGERESMKELGIVIDEELIRERLLMKGQVGLRGLTLRQAKAWATLELATEQSKNAMGDMARTMESPANLMKAMGKRGRDLADTLGVLLLPTVARVSIKIIELTNKMTAWVEKNPKLTKFLLKVAFAAAIIGPVLLGLSGAIAVVGIAMGVLTSPIGLIILGIAGITAGIIFLVKNWDKMTNTIRGKAIINAIKVIFDVWKTGFAFVKKGFEIFSKFLNGLALFTKFKDKLGSNPFRRGSGFSVQQTVVPGATQPLPPTVTQQIPAPVFPITQQAQKSSVDIKGNIKVEATGDSKIKSASIFDVNVGTNMAQAN